jgi:uncharacterized membrane protein YGL010W
MSPNLLLTIYTMLSSYCLAGCLMEHFAVFPGWLLVSAADLPVVQVRQGHGSLAIYVIPKIVLTFFIIYLWAFTTEAVTAPVSTASLRFSLAMLVISWISSFAVQIPLQLRIREGRDKSLVRRLIRTDWVRVLTMAAHCLAVVWAVAAGQER